MDIATLNAAQTPLDVYEAVQEAAHHGAVEFDFLPHWDGSDGLGILQNGKHTATLVTAHTPINKLDPPTIVRRCRMLRWWVPVHGGGTRLVAMGGQP